MNVNLDGPLGFWPGTSGIWTMPWSISKRGIPVTAFFCCSIQRLSVATFPPEISNLEHKLDQPISPVRVKLVPMGGVLEPKPMGDQPRKVDFALGP